MKLRNAKVMELIMLHRHQSRMLDQPIANQKNVLLTFQKLQK